MPDYMSPIFATHEAIAKAQVEADTWGHLAPQPRVPYPVRLVVAVGVFADDGFAVVVCDTGDMEANPWFYDDLHEWLDGHDLEGGSLHEFQGTYTKFKNGKHRFAGSLVEVDPRWLFRLKKGRRRG